MSENIYDVLIIGCGIGGCTAALRAANLGKKVLLITRSNDLLDSNTAHAQGGIIARGDDDSSDLLSQDVIAAGDGMSYPPAVNQMATLGPELVYDILVEKLGVNFNRVDGKLIYTQEAAHSSRRILFSFDTTGREIAIAMIEAADKHKNITILKNHTAVDLITIPHHSNYPLDIYGEEKCLGAYFLNNITGKVVTILARNTVLATGGIGRIYLHTTNPIGSRGDGLAMASRAKVNIINTEYIQFHPTSLYHRDADRFLITEAVRGEGAILRNNANEPFMEKYHPDADLAPRDVVARGIWQEMLHSSMGYVWLDLSGIKIDIASRFPTIYNQLLNYDIDITNGMIPVVPAAHYFIGGIKVDLKGRTNLDNLYAVGEVSCTGVHGANRLASTSLLEALTWGYRAGEDISENSYPEDDPPFDHIKPWHDTDVDTYGDSDPTLMIQDQMTVQTTMWNYVGIIRTTAGLNRAVSDLNYLAHRTEKFYRRNRLTDQLIGLRNSIKSAQIITGAAERNKNSLGAHHRIG